MSGIITHYSFDLMSFTLLAELPYYGVSWSQRLNSSGQFGGSLKLSDGRIKNLDPINATNPNKTLTLIDVDGEIVWGGINQTRSFDSTTQVLTVGAKEAWSYFSRRLQAADYTEPPGDIVWLTNPYPSTDIAWHVVYDAVNVDNSAFADLVFDIESTESILTADYVTASYPISQRTTVDQIVTTLAGGGYKTGFDFAIDWSWSAGQGSTPVATFHMGYPRLGEVGSATSSVVMTGGNASVGYVWPEDGTQQSMHVYGSANGSDNVTDVAEDGAPLSAFYPLLESYESFSTVADLTQLDAALSGILAMNEWPVVTPQFTMPLFGDGLSITDFRNGDDERVIIYPDHRFPAGVDTYLRLTGLDVTVPAEGLATMVHTLQTPPALAPVDAPPN